MLGEFPAWDVTLECERALPARLDAVLYPMAPGSTSYPSVARLASDERFTALQITGPDLDDTFLLCEEGVGPVSVGSLTFEGRALLLRRKPVLEAWAVAPVTIVLDGAEIAPAE